MLEFDNYEDTSTEFDSENLSIIEEYVSDLNSVIAALDDFTIIPGIHNIPLNDWIHDEISLSTTNNIYHIKELAEQIQYSRKICPLIIGITEIGPFLLEGVHRLQALYLLGAKTFPSVIVVDVDIASETILEKLFS